MLCIAKKDTELGYNVFVFNSNVDKEKVYKDIYGLSLYDYKIVDNFVDFKQTIKLYETLSGLNEFYPDLSKFKDKRSFYIEVENFLKIFK